MPSSTRSLPFVRCALPWARVMLAIDSPRPGAMLAARGPRTLARVPHLGDPAAPMPPTQREPALVVASIPALASRFAARCASAARNALAARGRFALAVPGGSVAERFFPALARTELEWSRVDLFFCDERCVPPENLDSNFATLGRLLLSALRGAPPRVHRMQGEDPDPARAARDYAETLRFMLGSPPVLDMAVLGVGDDGHIASLFPGRPSLAAADVAVLYEDAATKPPPRRLTLSLEVLASARDVVVAAFGSGKAAAIADALRNPDSAVPLALLLQRAGHIPTMLLDEEAARGLAW